MSTAVQAPAPAQLQDSPQNKLAREVYLPVFLHTLETNYGIRPKTAAQIDLLMQQAAVLRSVHEEQQTVRDPINIGAQKLAYLMNRANPLHQQADPHVTEFLRQAANNEDLLKTAAEYFQPA